MAAASLFWLVLGLHGVRQHVERVVVVRALRDLRLLRGLLLVDLLELEGERLERLLVDLHVARAGQHGVGEAGQLGHVLPVPLLLGRLLALLDPLLLLQSLVGGNSMGDSCDLMT